tara:strand:+ start:352 stop:1035 length:684 start_codon:yes stop_codon:yes gene_type:complete
MAAINTKTISEFKTKLSGGGARPNLFEVVIPSFPSGINDAWDQEEQRDFKFLCKASQLPGSTVPAISVPFRGRILKIAGDRTFDDWTITVINDESFNLRTAFEKWMNGISKLDDGTGIVNPNSYMTDAMVRQLGRSNTAGSTDNNNGGGQQNVILRTYNFFDIFPTEVSAIDLSYDTSDTIEEFTVTFAVQYYAIGLNVNDAPDPSQEQVPSVLASNDLLTQPTPVG